MKRLCLILLILHSSISFADVPTCHEYSSGNYCAYTGKVGRLYINASNVILMYFDTVVSTSVPASVGFSVNSGEATALPITDSNSEFAKAFYSTVLAAKLADKTISLQMRGTQSGYLRVDRIWLH